MVRKIIADTPINDLNTGSIALTFLEAAAANDFENNIATLNILELLNVDSLKNNDVDAYASQFGLERRNAVRSTGFVEIRDTSITPRKTSLYPVRPTPIQGDNVIFVVDASEWDNTGGVLYIGRGTQNFEGPINYTSIDNLGSFYRINLASSLEKDHLISDEVIDAQGTQDRRITAGQIVETPANNVIPAVQYRLLREAVIPAGENLAVNIPIQAIRPGARGNAGIDSITNFSGIPFPSAAVSNSAALTNGRDVETDEDFKERIKSYANSLARGTRQAIISAVVGVSSQEDSKQVESANIIEPLSSGEPSILYIDDGSGFQPATAGQPVDILLKDATGDEEFLQLSNFPLPRPQVVNLAEGPYSVSSGSELRVIVDGFEDVIQFQDGDFQNRSAATPTEIVVAINARSSLIEARLDQNSTRVLIYTKDFEAETIRVIGGTAFNNINNQLRFPTNEFSFIALYQNNERLKAREEAATLVSLPFPSWQITSAGNLVIAVDSTPAQDRSFDVNDFGGTAFNALTLTDWINAINSKYAGITASQTQTGEMLIRSNRPGNESKLEIIGGSYFGIMFGGQATTAKGQDSDFQINRQNGSIRIRKDIRQNDDIQAGADDTKGAVISERILDGTFNVGLDPVGRRSQLVIIADANRVQPRSIVLPVQERIKLEDLGSSIMRVTAPTATAFRDIQPGDFLFIVNRGDDDGTGEGTWIDEESCGVFKVVRKGQHLDAGVDTFVDVENNNIVIGTPTDTGIFGEYEIKDAQDIQAFYSDQYPQVWNGLDTNNAAAATVPDIIDSINNNTFNVRASIFRTNQIKITSSTEEGGSIAIPVITGNVARLFSGVTTERDGEFSHIANKKPQKDFLTYFKRREPSNDNVFLGRYVFGDVKGLLDNDVVPGVEGQDSYAEVFTGSGVLNNNKVSYDDYVLITSGNNKDVYRPIKQLLPSDEVGTRFSSIKTLMDYIAGDRFNIAKTYEFSDQDNLVAIFDDDAIAKTVDIRLARTARVNSGSNSVNFTPDNISFSGDDVDNETGIDFGNIQVWGAQLNGTNFDDYAVWFRARNWYVSGGVGTGGPSILLRASEYGPNGEKLKFSLNYPGFPDREANIVLRNFPDYSTVSYFFGSGPQRLTNIQSGNTLLIEDMGNYVFRYTFPSSVDLNAIQIGDIFSIRPDAGISAENRGEFRVLNVNAADGYVEVYNPNGLEPQVGQPEIYEITFPDDVPPEPAVTEIEVLEDASDINQKYIVLFNPSNVGTAFWFNNTGAVAVPPNIPGVTNYEEVSVDPADDEEQVNIALNGVINVNTQFSSSITGNLITVTNTDTGVVNLPSTSTGLDITVNQVSGGLGNQNSYNQRYMLLQDSNGPVSVWFDLDNSGSAEPGSPSLRSIKVSSANTGDNGDDIATAFANTITLDGEFDATIVGNTVTVTATSNGERSVPDQGNMQSGVDIQVAQQGIADVVETINIPTSVFFFPIQENSTGEIIDAINEQGILSAVEISSGDFEFSTRDEVYTPAGVNDYSTSLAFGHDPDPVNENNEFIGLYDSESWVLTFQNNNPNFTLKRNLQLSGVAPTVYQMDQTENEDGTTGEYFRLIPRTIENLLHHFTQKALSPLDIISDVDFANYSKAVQLKSNRLGSRGAIEIVGGRANGQTFSIIGDSQVSQKQNGTDVLEVRIPSFPVTFSVGQHVLLENEAGAARLNRLRGSDTIDVIKINDTEAEYRYNPKNTDFNRAVQFTIEDVSASYGRTAGSIWRWTHSNSGSFITLTDVAPGTISSNPIALISDGTASATGFIIETIQGATVDDELIFRYAVNGPLSQGDHLVFSNSNGVSYGVWISVDGDNTAPTSGQFAATTNKIRVNISSSDDDNTVIGQIATALITFGGFSSNFILSQSLGANLVGVQAGDILIANGDLNGWSATNKSDNSSEEDFSGWPIIAVNEDDRWFDIVNPFGVEMLTPTNVGLNSKVQIMPTAGIRWRLGHYARPRIVQAVVISGEATVTTNIPHRLNVGDEFEVQLNTAQPDSPGSGVGTVTEVLDSNAFRYTVLSSVPDGVYTDGLIKDVTKTVTKYRFESLGYNGLMRLQYVSGETPEFIKNGAAVDDILIIRGQSFNANNSGSFRVLAVEDDNIIFQNHNGSEQLNYIRPFNDLQRTVNWTNSSGIVTGLAGDFANLEIGDWVKKPEDLDTLYRQVVSFNTGDAETATEITLGATYQGTSSSGFGIAFNQETDVGAGQDLLSSSDIIILEGDSVRTQDTLFISETANENWFNVSNTGTYTLTSVGQNPSDDRPYFRVTNNVAVDQSNVLFGVPNSQMVITENDSTPFSSVKVIDNIAVDELNPNRRIMYLTPADRSYKFTQTNKTTVKALGKLDYSADIAQGVDGYSYYTGLLRRVQRIVDGYEPNQTAFPGRKAVGATIETLPPLIKRINLSITVATREGVNVTEITNDIKSTIIQYVNSLGVSQDVILSDIIVRVKGVDGVEAVTFLSPAPSEERIPILDNEKAFIRANNISVA